MIKINLLGRKKSSGGVLPPALVEQLEKLGLSAEDVQEMRTGLVRLALLLVGAYAAMQVPTHFFEQKKAELDQRIATLSQESQSLAQTLASKEDVRKQMDQLNKEENELQRQLNAINSLQNNRGLAFRTLNNLVVSLPPKVWLDSIGYQDGQIALKGSCWEYFPINDFVKSINESTQYTGVNFKGIVATDAPQKVPGVRDALQKTKNFELEFRVKAAGES